MRGRWSRAAAATLALGVACAMLPVFEDTKGQQASPPVVASNALRPVTAFAAIADSIDAGRIPNARIAVVITNKPDAPGIERAVAGRAAPQSNDVALDQRGLIYMVDRHVGFDILEFQG